MRIHFNIEADTTEEILAAIRDLAAAGVVHTQTKQGDAATENKKNSSPRNNKPVAQKSPEPVADTAEPKEDDTTPGEEEAIPTVEDLKAVAVKKGGTPEGKKAVKNLLAQFESPSISAIPEDKRAAFLAALEDL